MTPRPPARLREGRTFTSLGLAAGLAVPAALFGGPVPVTAPPAAPGTAVTVGAGQQPGCGDPDAEDFPIETRIHGGPDTYASGGGYGIWYLDLTNTTSESCHAIHPVLVLTDEDRKLTSEQIQLEFSDRTDPDEEHRVTWETTDRDEQVGVFGDGESQDAFPGFTVPAKRTVTVEVRMAFTSDTSPGKVTANAAIVQRRTAKDEQGEKGERGERGTKADGDWVGESADYRFVIIDGATAGGGDPDGDADAHTEAGTDPGTEPGARTSPDTSTGPGAGPTTGRPDASSSAPATSNFPELSRTGQALLPWAAGAGLLILGGLAVVLRARRTRRGDH